MKAIIELTTQIGLKFLEAESSLSEREHAFSHLPFQQFAIDIPQELFQRKEDVLIDLMNESGVSKEDEMYQFLDKLATQYISSMIRINVNDEANRLVCEVSNLETEVDLFKFMIPKGFLAIPLVHQNNFAKDDLEAGFMFTNIIYNVVQTFNNPTVVKKEIKETKTSNENTNQSFNKKRTGKKKTYLSTTRYVFEGLELSPVSKKDIKRLTEGWYVRGHFRKYPNGNQVWIKPYQKGTLAPTEAQEKQYKVLH